jgi:hypothetical protein
MSSKQPTNPPQDSTRPEAPPSPPKVQTMYNVKIDEKEDTKPNKESQKITVLREAHVTEITLDGQTLRVMDAGHIQGVINMIEKHNSSIAELNKGVNNLNRTVRTLDGHIRSLQAELDSLKGMMKYNGI